MFFLSRIGLYQHVCIHRGKYKCTECGRYCHSKSHLAVHKWIYSGEKPFECTVVANPLHSHPALSVTAEFTEDRNHTNVVCGLAFTQSGTLKIHMRAHHGEKRYKCVTKVSASPVTCSNINVTYTGRIAWASNITCGEAFNQSVHLKVYMSIHTEDMLTNFQSVTKVSSRTVSFCNINVLNTVLTVEPLHLLTICIHWWKS